MERSPADRHDAIIMWAFAKLDVTTRAEAVAEAIRRGELSV